jgi:hypothetical protein
MGADPPPAEIQDIRVRSQFGSSGTAIESLRKRKNSMGGE